MLERIMLKQILSIMVLQIDALAVAGGTKSMYIVIVFEGSGYL